MTAVNWMHKKYKRKCSNPISTQHIDRIGFSCTIS
jgi:hypothetical protein